MTWRASATSIRTRLTGWYGLVLAATLIVYATATYFSVRHEFLEQFDDQLHDEFESAEGLLERTPDGRIRWTGDKQRDPDDEAERVYEVWSASGTQLLRSGTAAPLPPVEPTGSHSYRYETLVVGGEPWRSLTSPIAVGGQPVILRLSRSEARLLEQLQEILVVLIVGLPLVVLLAGGGGYLLARRALAPIDHLATEAQRVTAERLHERLSVSNPRDEIGRLTAVINNTLGRLESSFDQLRRFTADASHELRTPLAVVRGIGESILGERRSIREYEEAIGSMLEEVDRMASLVDTLLRLSRADAGAIHLSRESVELGDLAAEAASSLALLAEERNQTLNVEDGDRVVVSIDRFLVREAVTNVLDNAIKYSPAGSTITVHAGREHDRAVLTVEDQGPGIPLEHRERIFHRFFRLDEGRSRDHGGAGLGLAIAKWAVEVHGGAIAVEERRTGGSTFRIVLPVTSARAGTSEKNSVPRQVGGRS